MQNYQAPTEDMAFIWSDVLQAPAQLQAMPVFAAVDADTTCKLVAASAKDRELAYWVAGDYLRVVAVTLLAWAWTQIGRASAAGSPAGAQADHWQAPARAVQQWIVPECAMRLSIINARLD